MKTGKYVKKLSAGLAAVTAAAFLAAGGPAVRAAEVQETQSEPALVTDIDSYSQAELRFCYLSVLEQFLADANGYESLLGLDASKPLSEQKCMISEEDMTWEEYFQEEAVSMLTYISGACQEAGSFGEELSDNARSYADLIIETYRNSAKTAGFDDLDDYLAARFEKGITETVIRRLMEQSYVADQYAKKVQESFSFTDEELAAYYEENAGQLRTYTYLYAYVSATGYESLTAEECKRKLLEADTEQDFRDTALELTGSEAILIDRIAAGEIGNPDAEDTKWITDLQRLKGDRFAGESGDDIYILFWLSCSDNGYPGKTDKDGDEAAWKEIAREKLAQEAFGEWKASLLEKSTRNP